MAAKSIVVAGGGISGLAAAHYAVQAGLECTLVEPNERLGGVIRTDRVDGCLVEAGPDSFIAQKPAAKTLMTQLGMADEIIGSNDSRRKTYVLKNGRLTPLPEGLQFIVPTKIRPLLTSPLFSLPAKLKMGLEWFHSKKNVVEDRSVADFVISHYGAEVNEYLAQPMLAGVYGGSPERMSVNSVLPRLVELEREFGSVSRGMLAGIRNRPNGAGKRSSLFLSLKNGMQSLVDRLRQESASVRVIRDRVVAYHPANGRAEVELEGGESITADVAVLALPAHASAGVLRMSEPEAADLLDGIPYGSSMTIALLYEHQGFQRELDGFGFLAPRREGVPLAACTWVNTKFDFRAAEDRIFLRAFLAGEQAEAWFGKSDDEIAASANAELQRIMGFTAVPHAFRVERWNKVMAQYEVGHQQRIEAIRSRLAEHRTLRVIGNGFDGIGVPDCIRLAKSTIEGLSEARSN